MGDNPYHNQHIAEFTACMDDALASLNETYASAFMEQQNQIEALTQRIEQLEQAQSKPVELEADITLSPQSVRSFRKKLMDLFRF